MAEKLAWVRAAKTGDVIEGGGVLLNIWERSVALLKSEGKFYAVDNICPHKGASLAEGAAENCRVTCPWHAWSFDLKTGECDTVPGVKIKVYPVKTEKDEIFVQA